MRSFLFAAVSLLLLVPPIFSQQSPTQTSAGTTSQQTAAPQTPVRDPQALALVQAGLSALGGSSAPIASLTASGTYTRFLAGSTVSYPLQVEALGYSNFRWQIVTPDEGTIITVVSGLASWSQSSEGTLPVSVGEIPGKTFESFPALALSTWANSSAFALKMVGPETIANRGVQHITITPSSDANIQAHNEKMYETTHQRELFLDQTTNLPVRLRYYSHPLDWRVAVPIEVEYSNFQSIAGIAFPMTITTYRGTVRISQIQYQSISLNAPVAASDFLPGGAQ